MNYKENEVLIELHDHSLDLFDKMPVMIWRSASDAKLDWFSSKWLEFTGRTMEQELADNWVECVFTDDLARFYHIYIDCFHERKFFEIEYRLKNRSGEYKWVKNYGQPYNDKDGNFAGYIGTCYEIEGKKEGKDLMNAQQELVKSNNQLEEIVSQRTKELAESHARFKATFNHAGLAMSIIAFNGEWVVFNEAYLDMFGYTEEELKNMNYVGLAFPGDSIEDQELVSQLIKGEVKVISKEKRYIHKNGSIVYGIINITSVKDEKDIPQYMIAVIQDITRSKKAEETLKESEERFRTMANQAPIIIWMTDDKGLCTYLNTTWVEFTGMTVLESVGPGWTNAIHPDDREQEYEKWTKIFESRQPYKSHFKLRRSDGEYRRAMAYSSPKYSLDGNFTGYIGIIIDVTEQELAQEELLKSRERFKAIFDQSILGIAQVDLTGHFDLVNDRYCKMVRRSREELLKMNMQEIINPEDLSKNLMLFNKAIEKGEPYVIEKRYLLPDGSTIWVKNNVSPVKNIQGDIEYMVALCEDVSEKKKFEQTIVAMNIDVGNKNKELNKANNDLDRFIYSASHDLKAPISNIEGLVNILVDIMDESAIPKEDFETVISMISQSVLKFKKTIQDITDIIKIQKNISEEITENANVCDLIEDIKASMLKQIESAEALINIDTSICPVIRFSKKDLKIIIYNIVSNAIKYRFPGRRPEIYIKTELLENYILMSVKDNGLGIDPDNMDKVFFMFKRFHDHVEGTGLGLYIVKRIIENKGGKIEIESEIGKGSEFKVYFPV